ncbi:heavy metal translocating P-type ATPase [Paracoccus fistulariae]|uniref:Copper-translocating P-type ATPase n=1 Tax=Paracoccus fistulariae TaxID=658446 RepID=A0ABY7SRT5_9RHOB|nr:heavy metal translocating P-type ATPase [Paracoccus fistulariae]MDB6182328.1 heavy metal translocating P-type ATPase [Paracoccus fistulariae]WCR08692.1 copper-translocating P-type ATPase [Paracoccus fistulariae]
MTTSELNLSIPGITCSACAGRVERALTALPGVRDISVNPVTKRAHLSVAGASLPDIDAALRDAGYPAEWVTTKIQIEGMSCASCAGRIERGLTARPEVTDVKVNLVSNSATIRHPPDLSPQALADAVTALGYPARPAADTPARDRSDPHRDEAQALKRRFLIALALTLPVFLTEMGGHLFPVLHHWLYGTIGQQPLWLMQMVLTALVMAGPGRQFFTTGIPALLRGAPEMNSLVALGAGAAFLYSATVTLMPSLVPASSRFVYFEAAAVIVTLILMGRWLEARAKGQAGQAIRALIELAPDSATLLRDGEAVTVPVADLRPGDLLRLAPGERVAVDGIITEGSGSVDEAMLTGEPIPASKTVGDAVTGGTVNGSSALTYRVTATGADTTLSRIVQMVEEAQAGKLPVQALVDRVTRVFVPVVIGLALLTFALWMIFGPDLAHAVVAAVAVLIIACPCAMGLAVPVSIMVGTGRGAQLGILFRRGDGLQRLAEAQRIAFDKTGTLTLGRPELTSLWTDGMAEDQILRLTAAAEAQSEHPLANAILTAAADRGLDLPPASQVEAKPGRGLSAVVEGHDLLIGNAAALSEAGITLAPDLPDAQGVTPVHVALDGQHRATLALSDPIRPEAAATVAALHDLGLQVVMLSGDVQATAESVGQQIGIDQVQGGLLPDDKLKAVQEMGEGSVFVGDGINDAPALAAADTGIAIGTGTDIAIESADVVLMSGDPSAVPQAIRLSRAVMRNIRQNLFWAFAYNTALIPVAMGVLVPFGGPQLSPMLAAGAMALSSVFVVGNALRLRRAA